MRLLTNREKEIFSLLINGYETIDISKKLFISEKTVRNHISNVIQKLDVKSRVGAVIELVRLGEVNL
jgi:LuxR family transcriptional regulator of spore coat protein